MRFRAAAQKPMKTTKRSQIWRRSLAPCVASSLQRKHAIIEVSSTAATTSHHKALTFISTRFPQQYKMVPFPYEDDNWTPTIHATWLLAARVPGRVLRSAGRETGSGVARCVRVPSPSCPTSLAPEPFHSVDWVMFWIGGFFQVRATGFEKNGRERGKE